MKGNGKGFFWLTLGILFLQLSLVSVQYATDATLTDFAKKKE